MLALADDLTLWGPWLAGGLALLVLFELLCRLRLDAKPIMLAAGALQRSCLGLPGYLTALAAAMLGLNGLRHGRRALGAPGGLVLVLLAYTLVSLYLRAVVEQDRFPFPDLLATAGPTFYKYIAHALMLYLALALGTRSRPELRRAVNTYALMMVPIALLALHQQLSGDNALLHFYWRGRTPLSLLRPGFERVTSLFFDPNHLGNFLVVGILLALGGIPASGVARRIFLAGAAALGSAALFCTSSLSNWIGLGVGLLLFAALRRAWTALVVALAVLLLLGADLGWHETLSTRIGPALLDKSLSLARLDLSPEGPLGIRVSLDAAALRMFAGSPLFGLGYGAFQARVLEDEVLMGLTRNICYAHNSFLLVMAELGLVGMVLLLAILASHVRLMLRSLRAPDAECRALAAALVAALAGALVYEATYGSLIYDVPLWTVLGLAVALPYLEKPCA